MFAEFHSRTTLRLLALRAAASSSAPFDPKAEGTLGREVMTGIGAIVSSSSSIINGVNGRSVDSTSDPEGVRDTCGRMELERERFFWCR